MNGHCSESDVFLKIRSNDISTLLKILKEFGSRNLHWYESGFDNLKNIEEILIFLKYKFHFEKDFLIINKHIGEKISNDPIFWKVCAPAIYHGHFCMYGKNENDLIFEIKFFNGKIVDDSK